MGRGCIQSVKRWSRLRWDPTWTRPRSHPRARQHPIARHSRKIGHVSRVSRRASLWGTHRPPGTEPPVANPLRLNLSYTPRPLRPSASRAAPTSVPRTPVSSWPPIQRPPRSTTVPAIGGAAASAVSGSLHRALTGLVPRDLRVAPEDHRIPSPLAQPLQPGFGTLSTGPLPAWPLTPRAQAGCPPPETVTEARFGL